MARVTSNSGATQMTMKSVSWAIAFSLAGTFVIAVSISHGSRQSDAQPTSQPAARVPESPKPPVAVGHPSFMSPHASPIAINGGHVFVVNTPSDTVDVISRKTKEIVARVQVGIDPVSIAVRPDGKEVWVSNHVSDSVSVIDSDPKSATYLHVVATIQQFDRKTKATRFDEPMGIAFASNEKAYVALSSENTIAVVDVATRKVSKRLTIPAQDPRAMTVRNGRLYVIPFESNNKTQPLRRFTRQNRRQTGHVRCLAAFDPRQQRAVARSCGGYRQTSRRARPRPVRL